jgi:predicted transcriptional regulator
MGKSKRFYERWTEYEIDSVLLMRSNGKTYAEIAKILGRSESAVTNAVHRERKRNSAVVDSMITQASELSPGFKTVPKNITRDQILKELLPGLNALFGSEYEKYENEHVKIYEEDQKKPTIFERIKRWLGIIR